MTDIVVTVAGKTLADAEGIERHTVRTLLKQLGLTAVARSANVRYRRYARGDSAMIAMAAIACGRGKIPFQKRFSVNA